MSGKPNQVRLENDELVVGIATAFGPRITHFSLLGEPNIFAELGDLAIDLIDGATYQLRGGHRLWVAPEVPEITYQPDDDPVTVSTAGPTATVVQGATTPVALEKTIQLTLTGGSVHVTHTVTNRGDASRDLAVWGITQLRPGGIAMMPLALAATDPHGLQPNASIVIWPYVGIADSPFTLGQRMVFIDTARTTATKVGIAMHRGWLAYFLNGWVFVKRSTHRTGGRYLDMGASGQVYAGPDFTELETLGEQQLINPGESISHTEVWQLHRVEPDTPPAAVPGLLGLDG